MVIVLGAWILHVCYMCYLLESSFVKKVDFCHYVMIFVVPMGTICLGYGESDGKLCALFAFFAGKPRGYIFCLNTPASKLLWFLSLYQSKQ